MERHPVGGEVSAIPIGRRAHGLVRRRPHPPGREVLHVTELTGRVQRAVGPPAGDCDVVVPAVPPAAVAHHDRVRLVAEEGDLRLRGVGQIHLAHHRAFQLGIRQRLVGAGCLRLLEHEAPGNPLVQEELRRADHRVGVKAAPPQVRGERVGERHEPHAHVVRHVALDDRVALARGGPGVVDGVAEAVRAEGPFPLYRGEVGERPFRIDHRGERRRVGGDDEVAAEPAFERQVGHAERAVLVGLGRIPEVVGAFARPPGHAPLHAVRDVPPHGGIVGAVENGERERPHDQHRHQVLEHAAAPRHERRSARGVGQRAAEPEPVIDGDVVLGDRDEAGETRLGGEQVVIRSVPRMGARLVPDREQGPGVVVEEAKVHPERIVVGAIRHRPQASHQLRRGRGPRREAAPRLGSSEPPSIAPDAGRHGEVTESGRVLGDQTEAPVDPFGCGVRGARGGRNDLDGVAGPLKGGRDALRKRARRRGIGRRGEGGASRTEVLFGGGHGLARSRGAAGASGPDLPEPLFGECQRGLEGPPGAPVEHRVVGDREARVPESDQVPGQVAAIDGRDVPGLEDPEVRQVVPVVEVSAETLHALERLEDTLQPLRHVLRGEEAEVVGAHGREELETDVGGRRAHRDGGGRVFLIVVRREPARPGGDEPVEEAPVEQRVPHRRRPAGVGESPLVTHGWSAERLGDGG